MIFGLFKDEDKSSTVLRATREVFRDDTLEKISPKESKRVIDTLSSQPIPKINPELESIITRNINNDVTEEVNKKPLIIHCCHHKTGTVVIDKVLRAIATHFNIKYQYCPQKHLDDDTDIWLDDHSHCDFSKINRPIIGTHMIRNPCAIIVSAYEYHKQTNEPWAVRKIKVMDGKSYKEILNELDLEDGMTFEMKNDLYTESSKNTIMDIYNWDYRRPNFLELKFEDLMTNYDGTLANMFKHYGFTRQMIDKSLELAAKYNLRNKTVEDLKDNKHVTNKNLDLDKWKGYFSNAELVKKFWKIYPYDIFDKIGYIDDNLNNVENFSGKKTKILFKGDNQKNYLLKEKIWKKYNGETMYLIA